METEKVPAKVDARKTGRCGTGARRSGDHDVKSEGELAEAAHETLEADPDIVALILFGSRARGDARPDSDWDVGVVSHREHLPRLGTNVDAMWIGTREIRNGYETGSIAAVILKYGRVLAARTEEWSAIAGRERPATAQGMQNELENMVGKLAYACESMCAGKDPTQIKWRAWRNRMSRGTEASADAAELLAKHVAAGLGITLRKKHSVGGIANAIRDEAGERTIGAKIRDLDYRTKRHMTPDTKSMPAEPEPVWAYRAERTMQTLAEVVEGARHGTGPFATLKTHPSAEGWRENIPFIVELVNSTVEILLLEGQVDDATATRLKAWKKACESGEGTQRLTTQRDPYGADAGATVRGATQLKNSDTLARARGQGVAPQAAHERGEDRGWEQGRNATEMVATLKNFKSRDEVALQLGKLGADLSETIRQWEQNGEVNSARAARKGMNWYEARREGRTRWRCSTHARTGGRAPSITHSSMLQPKTSISHCAVQ